MVLRELDDDVKNEYQQIGTRIRQSLWLTNPRARFDCVAEREQVVSVTRDDLLAIHEQGHVPHNTTIIVVGGIEYGGLRQLIDELIPVGDEHIHEPIAIHDDEYGLLPSKSYIVMPWPNRLLMTTVYACKYPRFEFASRDYILQRYVEEIFVNGIGSRLWHIARTARPTGYQLGGGVSGEYSIGYLFSGRIHSSPEDISTAQEALVRSIHQPLGEADHVLFDAVHDYLADDYETDYEGALSAWTRLLQRSVQGGDSHLVEEYFARMQSIAASVTIDEVEEVRAKVFLPERMVTAVIEP